MDTIRVELFFNIEGDLTNSIIIINPWKSSALARPLYRFNKTIPHQPKGFTDYFYHNPHERFCDTNLGFLYLKKVNILPEIKKIINVYIMLLFIKEKDWRFFRCSLLASLDLNERWFFEDVYKIIENE